MNEIGAIINVASFNVKKQPHITSLNKERLWGFSDTAKLGFRGFALVVFGDPSERGVAALCRKEAS